MQSLRQGYRALIVGASGGIGTALVAALRDDPACGAVETLSRATAPQVALTDEASVEAARTRPQAVIAALHPGTVATSLSEAYGAGHARISPGQSAQMLLEVLDRLQPDQTGGFFAYDGSPIEW